MSRHGAAVHASLAMHVLAKELVLDTPENQPVEASKIANQIRTRFPDVILPDDELVRIATEVAIGQARTVVFDA